MEILVNQLGDLVVQRKIDLIFKWISGRLEHLSCTELEQRYIVKGDEFYFSRFNIFG
jgi:hypothetical protein